MSSWVLVCVQLLSCVWLFVTPWTVAHQAPLSMGFHRQVYWSRLPFPTPGDLPDLGTEPRLLRWQVGSVPLSHQWSPPECCFALIWITLHCRIKWASQEVLVVKNSPTSAGGHGNLLKYSCLENPMDRRAWQATMGLQRVWHDWSNLACTHVGLNTIPHQAPLSIEFSRQENYSGLQFLSLGDLPNPESEPRSPALQADSLPSEPPGKPTKCHVSQHQIFNGAWLNKVYRLTNSA